MVQQESRYLDYGEDTSSKPFPEVKEKRNLHETAQVESFADNAAWYFHVWFVSLH